MYIYIYMLYVYVYVYVYIYVYVFVYVYIYMYNYSQKHGTTGFSSPFMTERLAAGKKMVETMVKRGEHMEIIS